MMFLRSAALADNYVMESLSFRAIYCYMTSWVLIYVSNFLFTVALLSPSTRVGVVGLIYEYSLLEVVKS